MNEQQPVEQEQRKAVRVEEVPPKRATRVPGPPKGTTHRIKSPLTIAREEMITTAVIEGVWFRVELGTVEAGDAKNLEALRSALGAVARGLGLRRHDYRTLVRAGAVYVGPGSRAKTKEEGND